MSCLFCLITDSRAPDLPENKIIDQSENFYAKAALGHFVPGYTLVLPKDHFICFAEVPVELYKELDRFIGRVRRKLKTVTGKSTMIFEHGPMDRMHTAGACIEHAHLHLLPVSNKLLAPLKKRFGFRRLESRSGIVRHRGERTQYVYMESPTGVHSFCPVNEILQTQFIRRLAFNSLGFPHLWDWRTAPLRDELVQFVEKYAAKT
jgi:diadenosine tetraphosphate (Ap4A) HIT family hydrolase